MISERKIVQEHKVDLGSLLRLNLTSQLLPAHSVNSDGNTDGCMHESALLGQRQVF